MSEVQRSGEGLPGWLDPLPDAEQMRAADAWAIEQQAVPSLDLMERAGSGLAELAAERAPDGRIAVVVGRGNNGGDGLVAARVLRQWGHQVDVLLSGDAGELRGDPATNLERLPGDPPEPFAPGRLEGAAGVVDALLGTGFSGAPRDPLAGAIEAINACGAAVVAADVPSGVDVSTGAVEGAAVRAHATATFHAPKLGLYVAPGKAHAGTVRVVDIGIPPGAPRAASAGLIRGDVLAAIPPRRAGSTKFTEGAVVVAGGSPGLTGAPCMAAEAAQRAGAGYVTVCVPESLNVVFELRLLEAMSRPLPDDGGALGPGAVEAVLESVARADAVVLGPGLGRSEGAFEFARAVAARVQLPLLLDADGLNAHAERLGQLASRAAPTVLTPHAGELARLLGTESAAVEGARLHHARAAAASAKAVVVLKGDDTLVAEPGGRVGVSAGGSPGLASAGTGDVLSGVAGALLAKGLDPFTAACAAVYLHAAAGRRAGAAVGAGSVIARDVIEALAPELRDVPRPPA
jgi:ADP-dependent NAD(P)H-hydrate dehydratase / NAD(P)H-hydrate epimerase